MFFCFFFQFTSLLLFVSMKHSKKNNRERRGKSLRGFPNHSQRTKSPRQPLKGLRVQWRGPRARPRRSLRRGRAALRPTRPKLLRPRGELLKRLLTSVSLS